MELFSYNDLLVNDGSSVIGDVIAHADGEGYFGVSDNSSFIGNGNFGTEENRLSGIELGNGSSFTLQSSKLINTTAILTGIESSLISSGTIIGSVYLAPNAVLDLRDGAVVRGYGIRSTIGFNNGEITTSGDVTVLSEISSFFKISGITVNSGSHARFGNIDDSDENDLGVNNIIVNGQLDLLDETTIYGNLSLASSGAKLDIRGNSQTITGDFSTVAGSTIVASVYSASSADKIIVSGEAAIAANTKLNVSFGGGATTAIGSSYVIVEGGSGSTISEISDSNILVNGVATNRFGKFLLETEVSGNNLMLVISNAFTPTAGSSRLYNIISSDTSSSGALYQLRQYIDNASTDAVAEAAIKSATPQVDNSNNRVSFNSAQESFNLVSNRLQALSGISSGDEMKLKSVWGQAFGSNISQGNSGSFEGYSANLKGMAFGADKEIAEDSYFGLAASYANSSIKSRSGLKHTSINAYQLNAYHGVSFDEFFWRNLAGFVWNDYKSNRSIPSIAERSDAKYSGQTYIARSEFGTNQKLENNFIFSPSLAITAARNYVDDYSESGAGTLSLNVKSKASNFFETRAGFALSNKTTFKNHLIMPELSMSYGYDFAHSKQKTSANFVGQTSVFDSTAANINRGSFKTGLGARIYKTDDVFFDVGYTFEQRKNLIANSIAFKAVKKF